MSVFMQIKETFLLSNSKDKDLDADDKKPIVPKLKKNKYDSISLSLKIDGSNVGFVCGPECMVSGDLSVSEAGKNIEVKCDAIFKISIRPQHKENFLSGNGVWIFNNIQQGQYGEGLYGTVVSKGLKLKKYKEKNRNGVVELTDAIMQNVKTGSKKTDFK
tara:strand:- start:62 stop:541 length:480 start_codon:yes stop_codon:yes gene_type:complete